MANPQNIEKYKWKPGQVTNPNGRPKGSKNLATLAAKILDDGGLDWDKVPIKGAAEMKKKYGNNGWQAILYIAAAQALTGNIKAMQFLYNVQHPKEAAGPNVSVQFYNNVLEQRERYGIN